MQYRNFGKTGLTVSDVGYGAWGIGKAMWVGADDDESLRSLARRTRCRRKFLRHGAGYGDGHSEQLIARAFGNSPDIILASKVPPRDYVWEIQPGAPLAPHLPARTRPRFAGDDPAQPRPRADRHLPVPHLARRLVERTEWLETVRQLKASGKVRFVGISIQNHQPANVLQALDTGLIDSVQVIYNIFDQSPEDELFPYCEQHGIGVIVRVPFDEGALTGKITPDTKFPEGDFRHNYFKGNRKQEVWDAVQAIVRDTGIDARRTAHARAAVLPHTESRLDRDSRHAQSPPCCGERRLL